MRYVNLLKAKGNFVYICVFWGCVRSNARRQMKVAYSVIKEQWALKYIFFIFIAIHHADDV